VEQYLLDEYVLPPKGRSELRRALALVGEPDYSLQDFHGLLEILLDWEENEMGRPAKLEKECLRALTTTSLALGILCRWAGIEGNLKNAVLASERTLLWGWDAIRKRKLTENKDILHSYLRLVGIYLGVTIEYFAKVQSHFHSKDGLARYCQEAALLTEQVFEQTGLIATIGYSHLVWGAIVEDQDSFKAANAIAESLEALISNHGCSGSPCYDGQVTDITMALVFLRSANRQEFAKKWIREIIGRLNFTFQRGQWFPISTDSFDDLVELNLDRKNSDLSKLMETSWLVPTIAQWAAILGEDDEYQRLVRLQEDVLKNTRLQLWYPDEKSDAFVYHGPAHFESGISEAPIILPSTAEEMRSQLQKFRTESPVKIQIISSAAASNFPFLDFLACRHFRTPVDPAYWQLSDPGEIGVQHATILPGGESKK
jgi:hypothetical protein